ncbi:MAG: hypothetical protein J0H75_05670 [Rhizobiales bacterium]|nr:hypothetical protein [Hyphomicrobiales bacterium]
MNDAAGFVGNCGQAGASRQPIYNPTKRTGCISWQSSDIGNTFRNTGPERLRDIRNTAPDAGLIAAGLHAQR